MSATYPPLPARLDSDSIRALVKHAIEKGWAKPNQSPLNASQIHKFIKEERKGWAGTGTATKRQTKLVEAK